MTISHSRTLRTARILAAVNGAAVLTGCRLPPDGLCSPGEAPVYAVDNPDGAQCIKHGHQVPDGMARYPTGRVSTHVGDTYDRWPMADGRWPMAKDYPWRDEVDAKLLAQVPASVQADPDSALPR